MKNVMFPLLAVLCLTAAAHGQTMTYQQAKQRLKPRQLPEFWVGDVADLGARFEKLSHGKVTTLAKSPGGRPLYLVTYGQREEVRHRANFNSAVGGQDPSAYMDKQARKKPVVYFIGPVHGQEVEGLPSPFNLNSAVYHISGAAAFTFECAHGLADPKHCQVSLDEILDIQLTLYEGILRFALDTKAADSVSPASTSGRNAPRGSQSLLP